MSLKPGLRDVARQAGVSLGTVSNVLNRPTNVSEEMRKIVREAIDMLVLFQITKPRKQKAVQRLLGSFYRLHKILFMTNLPKASKIL